MFDNPESINALLDNGANANILNDMYSFGTSNKTTTYF
ncbi:MPPV-158 ankyrin repeat protein [Magpiepox virus 2]|nr:MPPV-158 ankyrin repeat protein [Magpiepox virus 2]